MTYTPDQHPDTYAIKQAYADALFRNGLEDTSWRNDICASFSLHEDNQVLRLWIEAIRFEDRESEAIGRYQVMRYDAEMDNGTPILETNNFYEALGCLLANRS